MGRRGVRGLQSRLLLYLQDEEDEFEHLSDDEEFEGFDPDYSASSKKQAPPDLKIAKVGCLCSGV